MHGVLKADTGALVAASQSGIPEALVLAYANSTYFKETTLGKQEGGKVGGRVALSLASRSLPHSLPLSLLLSLSHQLAHAAAHSDKHTHSLGSHSLINAVCDLPCDILAYLHCFPSCYLYCFPS